MELAAPIYLKIKERLMEDIRDKSVSTPIDSERELAVKFDVSRMTVRRAVNELVAEMKDLDEMLDMTGYIVDGTVTQRFYPSLVPPEYSNLLNLEMNTPIIMVECKIHNQVGELVAIVKMYHNPNEKVIEMTL